MFIITAICFPLLLFAQSSKKVNKRLRADIQRISEQIDSLEQVYHERNPIYQAYRDSLRAERRQLGKYAEGQRMLWPIVDEIMANLKDLGENEAFEQEFAVLGSQKGNFPDSLVEKVARFAPTFRFVEPFYSEQMDYINSLKLSEQNEALNSYKDNAIKKRTDAIGIIENVNRLNELAPATLIELRSLLDFHKGYTERLFQFRLLITERKEQLKKKFCAEGPKGFSLEYQQIFPECFPEKKNEVLETTNVGASDRTDMIAEESAAYAPMPLPEPRKNPNDIYEIVDEVAEFPGGIGAMRTFLVNNMRYPQKALDMGVEGKCYLKFVVNAEGKISDVYVIRGVPDCVECDTEGIRVVSMMPSWKPARVDGKPVNSYFTLPITFKLDKK